MTAAQAGLASPTLDPRCGSKAGYTAHWRRGENSCEACRVANTSAVQAHRERKRAPTPDSRCGTEAGPRAHRRRGESTCEACRAAYADGQRARREHERALRALRPPRPAQDELDGAVCHPWTGSHDSRRNHESDEQWQARLALARRICGTCPVFVACRQLRDHYTGSARGVDGILAGQPTNPKDKP